MLADAVADLLLELCCLRLELLGTLLVALGLFGRGEGEGEGEGEGVGPFNTRGSVEWTWTVR